MSDFTTEEGTLTTPDGLDLYTKTWTPTVPIRARLVFIHGFSDHCNFYDPLFPSLARHGIHTLAFDQRGWGRSVHHPSHRGRTGPTPQVLHDMTTFLTHALDAGPATAPLFLAGHSMGGAQVLHYAARGPAVLTRRIRGFLVEAPLVALHERSRPYRATVALGRLAGRVLPRWQMVQRLDAKYISRDPEVCRAWEEDQLCHDTGTLEGLAGMLDRAAALESGEVVLGEGRGEGGKTRLWVGCGTGDMVVSEDAARRWFEESAQVEDKEYRVYENYYHKLHAEPGDDKRVFAEDVAKWILDRSGPLDSLDAATAKPKL